MGKRPYDDYKNATPMEITRQFMIVNTVKFLLDECASDCPQRFDCEDGAYESCCMAYKCGLGNTGFADTCDRCEGCLRDFGNGEHPEQPTREDRCIRCGGELFTSQTLVCHMCQFAEIEQEKEWRGRNNETT